MVKTILEKEFQKQFKENKLNILLFSMGLSFNFIIEIILIILTKKFNHWIFYIPIVICALIFLFVLFIFYFFELRKLIEKKKLCNEIHTFINEKQKDQLIDMIKNESKNRNFDDLSRVLAAAALIDFNCEKALIIILDEIKNDIINKKYNSKFISLIDYYDSENDQSFIHNYLFEYILTIQEKYFNPNITYFTYPSGQSHFSYDRSAEITIDNISKRFGFSNKIFFIRYNILLSLQKIFTIYESKNHFELSKLAKLCRASEEETLTVLRGILDIAPQLGEYKEFEMVFIPSIEIKNFDTYIDILQIKNGLKEES